jgi:hypothetical protein
VAVTAILTPILTSFWSRRFGALSLRSRAVTLSRDPFIDSRTFDLPVKE